jgi:hypothetical protein
MDVMANLYAEESMTILNPDDPPIIEVKQCNPAEIVIADWRMLQGIFTGVSLSRADAKLVDNALTPSIARQIALERDLAVWSSWDGNLNLVGLAEYSEVKGLSVMIPWVIVVLNVIITVNSMFERRENGHLSSVGLNLILEESLCRLQSWVRRWRSRIPHGSWRIPGHSGSSSG